MLAAWRLYAEWVGRLASLLGSASVVARRADARRFLRMLRAQGKPGGARSTRMQRRARAAPLRKAFHLWRGIALSEVGFVTWHAQRLLDVLSIWQREATTTVTELLAAAADLESLAEERMRLLRTVTALRRKPKRHVPENFLEKLPDVVLNDQNREEPCPICLCRLDGKDAEATQPHAKTPAVCLECTCKKNFHRACLERWLRTKNTCPTCRYELPYEEEPELTIEVEDEENEAQRLADGEVAATAAAREAAASLVELAAYDAMTHAEEATPPRVRTARAAAAAAALREVAAEPPLHDGNATLAALEATATRTLSRITTPPGYNLGGDYPGFEPFDPGF